MGSSTLPFKLTNNSVSIWLQSLDKLGHINSANQLHRTISLLKNSKTEAQDKFNILKQLIPTALHVCSNIESMDNDDLSFSSKEKKIQKLLIQLIRNLSLNFYSLSKSSQLSANEQNQALYLTLQLLGHTQRISVIFHRPPSSILWKITGKIYNLAYNKNILNEVLNPEIKAFKKAASIEATLKRNILFSLSCPYRYNTKQINILFSIARKYAHLLVFHSNPALPSVFYWDSSSSNSPSIKQPSQLIQNYYIYLDTTTLVVKLKSPKFSTYLKKENLGRIIDELTGYDRITNSPVPSIFSINQLLVGLNPIASYLEKTEKLNKIQELSFEPGYGETNSFRSIETQNNNTKANNSNQIDTDKMILGAFPVKTLSLKNENYTIIETNSIDCVINDIVLFCSSNPHPELGIIRQIKANQSATSHILIEKLVGKPSSTKVVLPDDTEHPAIYLQNTNHSIFIAPCDYSVKIKKQAEQEVELTHLIDHSHCFMQYTTSKVKKP